MLAEVFVLPPIQPYTVLYTRCPIVFTPQHSLSPSFLLSPFSSLSVSLSLCFQGCRAGGVVFHPCKRNWYFQESQLLFCITWWHMSCLVFWTLVWSCSLAAIYSRKIQICALCKETQGELCNIPLVGIIGLYISTKQQMHLLFMNPRPLSNRVHGGMNYTHLLSQTVQQWGD